MHALTIHTVLFYLNYSRVNMVEKLQNQMDYENHNNVSVENIECALHFATFLFSYFYLHSFGEVVSDFHSHTHTVHEMQ